MVESELTFDCKLQVDAAWKVDKLGTRLARLKYVGRTSGPRLMFRLRVSVRRRR